MNLDCLNNIITDCLAIHIDISDADSWNLNTGFTSISLSQWANAKSDNINLYDFGLTEYDNGRVNRMYDTLDITPQDLKVELYRVGYNTGGTAYSGETQYDLYPMSAVTTGSSVGNYFELDGGYLQGFFKLNNYNYELFPQRYNLGITIEAIFRIDPDSSGTLFLMGTRAEDKYNPEFSGETEIVVTTIVDKVSSGVVGRTRTIIETNTGFTGVQTSEENFLTAYEEVEDIKQAFSTWEDNTEIKLVLPSQSGNTKSNVIAFSLMDDKRIEYKYIDDNNLVNTKLSTNKITTTGWTIIDMVFEPEEVIEDYDPSQALCYDRRKGTLTFYINGREFWRLNDFDEFFFKGLSNDREKQIGVPYSISFGGGSFGLKHSYHYDTNVLDIYTDQDQTYIENNFGVTINPLNEDACFTGDTGGSYNSLGLVLSADTTTFNTVDDCDPLIEIPTPVMDVKHTGGTGTTTLNEYYIEFDTILPSISNRDIKLEVDIYDTGIFKNTENNSQIYSRISLIATSDVDLTIKQETIFSQPNYIQNPNIDAPFSTYDGSVYQYEDEISGLLIDGQTGYPVITTNQTILTGLPQKQISLSGINDWKSLETTFQLENNTGLQTVKVGILIESTATLNEDFLLYIKNFKFNEQDVLVQDESKDDLLIEQNFDSSYKGGIQKLRIYDSPFNSQEVLHNAKIELENNPNYNYTVATGGRLIYR